MEGTGLQQVLGLNPESIQRVIELIPAPVFVLAPDGRLEDFNQAFLKLFQLTSSAHGKPLSKLVPKNLQDALRTLLQVSDNDMHSLEAEFGLGDQPLRRIRLQYCRFGNQSDAAEGIVGLIFDITEDSRRFDRLRQLSILDELTSLPNRRHGLERVQNLLQQSQRNDFSFSFLMLDVDNFKAVNDYEGHQAGDSVLQDIAEIVQELCRSYDLAFRYGGDEFIICLPNTGPEAAIAFAERIRSAVAAHAISLPDGTQIKVSISVGVASFPADGEDLEQLMSAADSALYQAKQQGRNRVVVGTRTRK